MNALEPATLCLFVLGLVALLLGILPARLTRRLSELVTGRRRPKTFVTLRGPPGYGVHLDKFRVMTHNGVYVSVEAGTRVIPKAGELQVEVRPEVVDCIVHDGQGHMLRISGS